jgi:hypothetical protein
VRDQDTEIGRRFSGWLALTVLAAFLATLALAQVGVGVFLSPKQVLAAPHDQLGEKQSTSRLTVIGTSLSKIGTERYSLAAHVERLMRWQPGTVINAASNGYQMGDLFAELIHANRVGSPVALIELNPFLFNERRHLLGTTPEEGSVTLKRENAVDVLPQVRMQVRLRIARQIGLGGAVNMMVVDRFSRMHDASSVEHLDRFRGWLFDLKGPRPTPLFDEANRAKVRDVVCRNFSRKDVEGVDLEVYEDLLAWAASRRSQIRVLLFVPPLNRKMVSGCGTEALDRLNAVVRKLVDEAQRLGFPIGDLSHGLDGREDAFRDYGHLEHPDDFFLWQPELSRFLSSTGLNEKDS